jgi:hypothetical protein
MTTNMTAVYQVRAAHAWTGDEWGHEWRLGWTVYPESDGHEDGWQGFALYEDDGRGNGDYVASFDTIVDAARAADWLAMEADARMGVS